MAVCAIYQKEWFKLKWYALVLVCVSVALGIWFGIDLTKQFAVIEPESMMWYRFVHLGDKPYSWLLYCFVITGAITAVCQFVPEVVGKRVRILTHLPVPLGQVVAKHLLAGGVMIIVINGLLIALAMGPFVRLYPVDITHQALKDMLFGQFVALTVYLGLVACLIETDWKIRAAKGAVSVLFTLWLLKNNQEIQGWVGLIFILALSGYVIDSFLSIKTIRYEKLWYKIATGIAGGIIGVNLTSLLFSDITLKQDDYYVFYSPVLEQYVYQHNGEEHQFSYGSTSSELSQAEFEAALPFVYWKNLDIQGKLPVTIDGSSFGKRQIRNARMSLQYDPDKLKLPQVAMYPLFNPISHKGAIPFPEQAFVVESDKLVVYEAETAQTNEQLTEEINQKLLMAGVTFPIKNVWGKTTNMKPFDWGYFIKDSQNHIFNMRRADGIVNVAAIDNSPLVTDIVYIQVSENRHKEFYGYAISETHQIFVISYPDYEMIPLNIRGFDYKSMSFQLLADPLHYLMRFNDGNHYIAVRYDKAFNKLDKTAFPIRKTACLRSKIN